MNTDKPKPELAIEHLSKVFPPALPTVLTLRLNDSPSLCSAVLFN